MNKVHKLAALFLLAACSSPHDILFVRVDPARKLFPENSLFQELKDTLDVAAGSHAVYQFAINSPETLEDVSFACEGLSCGSRVIKDISCGLVGYVGISQPAFEPAHDALRSVSGLFPDPILTDPPFCIPRDATHCSWVTVKVPEDTPPGLYKGTLRLQGKSSGRKFNLENEILLKVWPVVMEEPSFNSINWAFDLPHILKLWNAGEEVERYSDLYWEYVEQLADMLKGAYQTSVQVPVFGLVEISMEGDEYRFDFSHFDKWIKIFEDKNALKLIQGEELGGRLEPAWLSNLCLYAYKKENGRMVREKVSPSDKLCKEFYKQFLPAFTSHLKETGFFDRYVQRLCDEPIDFNAESYKEIAGFIKGIVPDLRILEALQTVKIDGAVDIWVPQMNTWHENHDFFRGRQALGEEVWFYTCCYPKNEYPNRFIEQPLQKGRLLYWMAYKYGADGFLHWGFNYWNNNPYFLTDVPTGTQPLPGGDSWIVYPGFRKFERSLRYEAMRDGIEDYTLLKMLEKKDPAKAKAICDSVIFNWFVYSTSGTHLNVARRQLLKALAE